MQYPKSGAKRCDQIHIFIVIAVGNCCYRYCCCVAAVVIDIYFLLLFLLLLLLSLLTVAVVANCFLLCGSVIWFSWVVLFWLVGRGSVGLV